jgi:hypothetical protein
MRPHALFGEHYSKATVLTDDKFYVRRKYFAEKLELSRDILGRCSDSRNVTLEDGRLCSLPIGRYTLTLTYWVRSLQPPCKSRPASGSESGDGHVSLSVPASADPHNVLHLDHHSKYTPSSPKCGPTPVRAAPGPSPRPDVFRKTAD